MTHVRRTRRDSRVNMGMETWLNQRYLAAGGFPAWVQSIAEDKRPEEQAVLFGVTVVTIYEWRKWYEESK